MTIDAGAAPFPLALTRFIRAPRERVYDAFVAAEALRTWKCPRGMHVAEIAVDHRVGGAWRMVMQSRDGSRFKVGGVYRELQPPQRIAYTWQWEEGAMAGVSTLIEVSLAEQEGGTLLEMRHFGLPTEAARDGHSRGWNASLNKLVESLDPRGTSATLTLHGHPASTYTRTVRMAMAEKGIAFTLHPIGPHTPELLALNPFGYLPVLGDGDFTLYETSAIVRYIDECFDGPALVPGTIGDRARCEQWVSAFNAHLYDALVLRYIRQYFLPRGANGQPDRAVIDAAVIEVPRFLAILDRGYEKTAWLAGESLSMADLFVAPVIAYLERMPEGPGLLAATPHLRRALDAMRIRPAFIATEPPGLTA